MTMLDDLTPNAASGTAAAAAFPLPKPSPQAASLADAPVLTRMQLAVKFDAPAPTPEVQAVEALLPLLAAASLEHLPLAAASPELVKGWMPAPSCAIELNKAMPPAQAAEAGRSEAAEPKKRISKRAFRLAEKARLAALKAGPHWACFELEGLDRLPLPDLVQLVGGVYFLYQTTAGRNARAGWLLKDVWIVIRRPAAMRMTPREAAASVLAGLAAALDVRSDESGRHAARLRAEVRLARRRLQGSADAESLAAPCAKRPADGYAIVSAECRALLQKPLLRTAWSSRWLFCAPLVFDAVGLARRSPAGQRLRSTAFEQISDAEAAGEAREALRGVRLFIGMPSLASAVDAHWSAAEAASASPHLASLAARCPAIGIRPAPELSALRRERYLAAVERLLQPLHAGKAEFAEPSPEAAEAENAARSLLEIAQDAALCSLLSPKGALILPWSRPNEGRGFAARLTRHEEPAALQRTAFGPLRESPKIDAAPDCIKSRLVGRHFALTSASPQQKTLLEQLCSGCHEGIADAQREAGAFCAADEQRLIGPSNWLLCSPSKKAQGIRSQLRTKALRLLKKTAGELFLELLDRAAEAVRTNAPQEAEAATAAAKRWLEAEAPEPAWLRRAQCAFEAQMPATAELFSGAFAATAAAAVNWAVESNRHRSAARCRTCRLCAAAADACCRQVPFALVWQEAEDAIRQSAGHGVLAGAADALLGRGEHRAHSRWAAFEYAVRRFASSWHLKSAALADALERRLIELDPAAALAIKEATQAHAGMRSALEARADEERRRLFSARRLEHFSAARR